MFGKFNANSLNTVTKIWIQASQRLMLSRLRLLMPSQLTLLLVALATSLLVKLSQVVIQMSLQKSRQFTNRQLQVFNRSGIFTIPETVTGQTSGAAWTSASYNTLNNVNTEDSIDQNFVFETADDDIVDFSEGNPFDSIQVHY